MPHLASKLVKSKSNTRKISRRVSENAKFFDDTKSGEKKVCPKSYKPNQFYDHEQNGIKAANFLLFL
jgi:hypothetical protein